ncbi:signal peptidase I [Ornithinibacillus bavariensis]|uniref:signal peptidase I n=1 Tax=Ornithinibacillus bavariensis TaxID=545502 RepID=UPI000ED1CD5F|nr:signal peptidase I [Ornithinibacillus sp.]
MNKEQLDQTLSDLNRSVARNLEDKERTLSKIRLTIDNKIPTNKYLLKPPIALMISAVLFVIIFISINNGAIFRTAQESTITDPYTERKLEKVNMEDGMLVITYGSDNMEWGDNPYNYLSRDIVVDPGYYEVEKIQRGDVVFYNEPEAYFNYVQEKGVYSEDINDTKIARIIALPSEEIKIVNGQIYINNRKLDTFYGNGTNNIRSNDYEEEYNMETIRVPKGHIFVCGDLWWRGLDSKEYGPIPMENIIGKVMGYQ